MNKYVNQMKQAVMEYQKTARRIADQEARNRERLSEEYARAENNALFTEMREACDKAYNQIQAVLDTVSGGLGKAVELRGKDVTEDVQLLSGAFDLSKTQLQGLVTKYRNNPTMMNAIAKYAKANGIHGVQIPTEEDKLEAYKVFAEGARSMIRSITTDPYIRLDYLEGWGEVPVSSERLVDLVGTGNEIK